MLPLSNQQSHTSEIRCNNPFPQREGMVRWSMLVNKEVNEEVAASINFKQNRAYRLILPKGNTMLSELSRMYLQTEILAIITGLRKVPSVLSLEGYIY